MDAWSGGDPNERAELAYQAEEPPMIVVRIELWPGGDSRGVRSLEQFTITNIGRAESPAHDLSIYAVRHRERSSRLLHRRADGPLVLVERALTALDSGPSGQSGAAGSSGPTADPGVHADLRAPVRSWRQRAYWRVRQRRVRLRSAGAVINGVAYERPAFALLHELYRSIERHLPFRCRLPFIRFVLDPLLVLAEPVWRDRDLGWLESNDDDA